MTEKKAEQPQINIIDNPQAPDFFVSWVHGFGSRHGNIHVTFVNDRPNHTVPGAGSNMVVTGRLIMPAVGARDLAERLLEFLDKIEKGPTPDVQGSPTLQ